MLTYLRYSIILGLMLFSSCSSQNTSPTPPELPYTGLLTFDEYDWFGLSDNYKGVLEVKLPSGEKKRILDGSQATRYPDGRILFRQVCGERVHRLALRDAQGLITVVSPCSSDIANPGASKTDFGFSKLSPDGTKIAAELVYFLNGFQAVTRVFSLDGQMLADFENLYAPAWLADGRLLLAGEGLYLTDSKLENLSRLDGGKLNAQVNNPAVDPTGEFIAFEYNQQIWLIDIDGSNPREIIFSDKHLRYPTWSPDGKSLAYLATEADERYDKNVYFTDLLAGKSYALKLFGEFPTSVVPNGPLSWTER